MKSRETIWTLVVALMFCAASGFAQNQKQDGSQADPNAPLQPLGASPGKGTSNKPPVGAARGVSSPYDTQAYDPSQVTPDQNTLAGAAPYTLGSLQHARNIFDPAITISQLGQTIPDASGKTILTGVSVASASLNFDRTWSEYHFSTLYNGGETWNLGFGAASSFFGKVAPHYQFHDLQVSQEADWGRWRVLLRDDFTVSPGAAFTGQGMGGPGLATQFSSVLGTSLSGTSQVFLPSESVNTGFAMRYRNSVLGQVEYSFSRRSAVTFSGTYGLLHFTDAGYFSSTLVGAQAGYDYLLDPFNSIAILGSYGKIDYSGTGSTTTVNGVSATEYGGALAYGRKITGRLAFQASAGPEEIQYNGAGGIGNFHLLFVSVNSALTYNWRRSSVSLNYVRGLTGGSGAFVGATGDIFTGMAQYQFTRNWRGTVSGGYALNHSLAPAGTPNVHFNNWFVGANLGRRVGPHAQFNFNYGASQQISPALCPVASCGGTGLQQTFGLSVNWHLRPTG